MFFIHQKYSLTFCLKNHNVFRSPMSQCVQYMSPIVLCLLTNHYTALKYRFIVTQVTIKVYSNLHTIYIKDVQSYVLRTFLDRSKILHHISFLLVNFDFRMPIILYSNKKNCDKFPCINIR